MTPQSLTSRNSDSPRSVDPCERHLPTAGKCIDTGRCKDNCYECLTSLTLNTQLTTRVNHYLNTRLSNWKELGNEYIATEAEALKEECGFCSRKYFKVDVLK